MSDQKPRKDNAIWYHDEDGVPMKNYWCCKADFGEHEESCPNYSPENPIATTFCAYCGEEMFRSGEAYVHMSNNRTKCPKGSHGNS